MIANHLQNTRIRTLLSVSILGMLSMPCLSLATEVQNPAGFIKIAEMYGISVAEVQRRHDLRPYIQDMERRIKEGSRETFAGLYLKQEPEFRVVVMLVGDARAQLSNYTLDPLFVPVSAPRTLEHLKGVREELTDQLSKSGINFIAEVNVEKSEIDLSVLDPIAVTKLIAPLRRVAPFIRIHKTTGFIETTSIVGGGRIRGPKLNPQMCTAGFNVVDEEAELGVVTAGHCANPSTYTPTSTGLVLQDQRDVGSLDVEWHKQRITSARPKKQANKVAIPEERDILGIEAPMLNDTVCKYGIKTGFTCGKVTNLNSQSMYNGELGSYVRVAHPQNLVMNDEGNSGGPVLSEDLNIALGIVHGRGALGTPARNDLFYMPVDRLAVFNISVVTEPFDITSIPDVTGVSGS